MTKLGRMNDKVGRDECQRWEEWIMKLGEKDDELGFLE